MLTNLITLTKTITMFKLFLLILAIAFFPEKPCDLTLFEFISSIIDFPTIGQENLLSFVFTIKIYYNQKGG